MSVIYRGTKPSRNYSLKDFRRHDITLALFLKWKHYEKGFNMLRVVFRTNGLLAEISSVYDGSKFAIDTYWGWSHGKQQCLTTECKSLREAKSIVFQWFKEQGFRKENKDLDYGYYLKFDDSLLTY